MCRIVPAGGRHGWLRLPAPAAHMSGARDRGGVLDGWQPKGLRLAEMLGNGPFAWNTQKETWGFSNRHEAAQRRSVSGPHRGSKAANRPPGSGSLNLPVRVMYRNSRVVA